NEAAIADITARREARLTDALGKEELISSKLDELRAIETDISDLKVRLEVLRTSISDSERRGETVALDIKRHRDELDQMNKSASDLSDTVDAYERSLTGARESLSALAGDDAAAVARQDEARELLSSLSASIGALESRIGALRRMSENFDGYNYSVKYVMNEASAGNLRGIHGPVSHLITVDDEYIIAIECALGSNLQNIIVDDEAAAKGAMYSLKRSKSGRATFYPISTVRAGELSREAKEASGYPGFIGYADTLVKYSPEYDGIIKNLLSRIPVFDNIDNASAMAREQKWRVRAVTLDGQQVNVGGSFTGGSVRRDSGVLTRNSHIEKLSRDKDSLEKEYDDAKADLDRIISEREEIAGKIASLNENVEINETLLRAERAALDEENAKIEVKSALIAELEEDAKRISELAQRGADDVKSLEEQIAAKDEEYGTIQDARFRTDIELSELRESIEADSEELTSVRIAMTENRKDCESIEALRLECLGKITSYEAEIASSRGKIADLEEQINRIAARLAEMKTLSDKMKDELSEAEAMRRSLEEGELDYERRINEIRKKLDEISSKKELLFIAHTKNESRLESLTAECEKMNTRLWDEYELTAVTASQLELPAITKENRAENHRHLVELKSSIKALGHVNPDAIEEYAELKERYDYLSGQLKDLNESKAELEKIISSVEEEMKVMFVKTFNEVNENFRQVFTELFGGGSAHLTLTDPDDVLMSGIEISAAPPGKMIKNLSLLSGGEQSFVAIALIFALIKVNPSPFCIFDEIEAALDEVNVTRVANYIKRYSKEIQMIVISHRRGLMEIADSLYGVTMPRRGISKVFVLDVDSVSEKTMKDNMLVE
ncbi:MAG: chromosome segregation protein SMC, partial [Clostridia bacterium]|nr:chromosome segregation protein SMC [Clostridia bacterium]